MEPQAVRKLTSAGGRSHDEQSFAPDVALGSWGDGSRFRSHANGYQSSAGGAAFVASRLFKRWTVIGPDYSYRWDAWGTFVAHLQKHKSDVDILSV